MSVVGKSCGEKGEARTNLLRSKRFGKFSGGKLTLIFLLQNSAFMIETNFTLSPISKTNNGLLFLRILDPRATSFDHNVTVLTIMGGRLDFQTWIWDGRVNTECNVCQRW